MRRQEEGRQQSRCDTQPESLKSFLNLEQDCLVAAQHPAVPVSPTAADPELFNLSANGAACGDSEASPNRWHPLYNVETQVLVDAAPLSSFLWRIPS